MKLTIIFTITLWQLSLTFFASHADILQNSDFELPPSNWIANTTSPFYQLNGNNTIPGWTFEGRVEYVTAGPNVSLPGNAGHAILLRQDGKLNQTFTATGDRVPYLITFTLANGGQNCRSNASLVVSAPNSSAEFAFRSNYSREPWQVYGHQLGIWGDGESVNLVLESQAIDSDSNSTCWPLIDNLTVNALGPLYTLFQYNDKDDQKENLLPNGGFEFGPTLPERFGQGVLLVSRPSRPESALQNWTVTGTVKYTNLRTIFRNSEDKGAIEIVSGRADGIQTAMLLSQGSPYSFEFRFGDANNSCMGGLTIKVTIGSRVMTFTMNSTGSGLVSVYGYDFEGAGPGLTPISFKSEKTLRTADGVLCGPLVADVVISQRSPVGERTNLGWRTDLNDVFLVSLLIVVFLQLSELT